MRDVKQNTAIKILTDPDDAFPFFSTFGAFLADNEFSGEEITQIATDLRETGRHEGGGGAAAGFIVEIA